jgi:hypothetical protein
MTIKGTGHIPFIGEKVNLDIIFVGIPEGNGQPRKLSYDSDTIR